MFPSDRCPVVSGGVVFREKKQIIWSVCIPVFASQAIGIMQSKVETVTYSQKFPWKNGFRLHEKRAGVSMGITTERRKKQ